MIKSLVVVHGIVLTDSCLGAMATYICVYTNSTCMYIYICIIYDLNDHLNMENLDPLYWKYQFIAWTPRVGVLLLLQEFGRKKC